MKNKKYNALPNIQLPPFYGNSLEFAKWWQMFIYLVDKNLKIPQIMKLHLLQKSLTGNAEYLMHQITFSPTSYETLKENVKDAFDDADATLCLLTDRWQSWPILKRHDYKQLAEVAGFATNYVMQLMHFEGGAAFNPRNVIKDIYEDLRGYSCDGSWTLYNHGSLCCRCVRYNKRAR